MSYRFRHEPSVVVPGRCDRRIGAGAAVAAAPTKRTVIFERSGHRTLFQQPDLLFQLMTTTVLAQT